MRSSLYADTDDADEDDGGCWIEGGGGAVDGATGTGVGKPGPVVSSKRIISTKGRIWNRPL